MTKRELLKQLAQFQDDMEIVVCSKWSAKPRVIERVEGYRIEKFATGLPERFLQHKAGQAAPDNVAVIFVVSEK